MSISSLTTYSLYFCIIDVELFSLIVVYANRELEYLYSSIILFIYFNAHTVLMFNSIDTVLMFKEYLTLYLYFRL